MSTYFQSDRYSVNAEYRLKQCCLLIACMETVHMGTVTKGETGQFDVDCIMGEGWGWVVGGED